MPSDKAAFAQVLLVRHGRTEWSRLTGTRTLAGAPVTAVFTSPLGRARTTAEIVAAAVDRPLHVVPEPAEGHHGDFAGLNEQIAAAHPAAARARAADKYRWRFPNGESYADVHAAAGVAAIAALTIRPLVVSHEMLGRLLLRNLLAEPPVAAPTREHPHE